MDSWSYLYGGALSGEDFAKVDFFAVARQTGARRKAMAAAAGHGEPANVMAIGVSLDE